MFDRRMRFLMLVFVICAAVCAEGLVFGQEQQSQADFKAFSKAEILFSKGKLSKAFRAYDKLVSEYPLSKLYNAAIDRQFAIGMAYLGGAKKTVLLFFRIKGYAEGIKIMEKLSDRLGDSPLALRASLAVVDNYEKRNKFDDAYHKWSEIQSRWPTGQTGRDALLGMAKAKYACYAGPKYDASSLISAKSYYENFKLRYPETAAKIGVDETLRQINEQVAAKELLTADYYARSGYKLSANLYYQMVAGDWPGTAAAKKARTKIK